MRSQPLNEIVSLSLLEHLSLTTSNRAALGSQAMFHLQGKGIPQDLEEGRMRLLVAARSYDRLSAARLAIYYQKGKYGFRKDVEASEFWRGRVTEWLRSDAALSYNDPGLKQAAIQCYEKWEFICKDLWGITITKDDLPEKQSRL